MHTVGNVVWTNAAIAIATLGIGTIAEVVGWHIDIVVDVEIVARITAAPLVHWTGRVVSYAILIYTVAGSGLGIAVT